MVVIRGYSLLFLFLIFSYVNAESPFVTLEDNSRITNYAEEKYNTLVDQTKNVSNFELPELKSDDNLGESNENSGHEQAKVSEDIASDKVPLGKIRKGIRPDTDTASTQNEETTNNLLLESDGQSHKFEFQKLTETDSDRFERDPVDHSHSSIENKPMDDQNQNNEYEDKLRAPDQTEQIFTDIDENGESFTQELTSAIESKSMEQMETDGNFNKESTLELERFTREMNFNTVSNLEERAKSKDSFKFNNDIQLNQTIKNLARGSESRNESKPVEQKESEDFITVSENVFRERSYESENDFEIMTGRAENDNFHSVTSFFKGTGPENMTDSKTEDFDPISEDYSQEKPKLVLESLKRANSSENKFSNDFGLFKRDPFPKDETTVKETVVPPNITGNDIYLDGYSENSEIASEYIAHNTPIAEKTETEDVESPKQTDSSHVINYQSEPDTSIGNSPDSLVSKDVHETSDDGVKGNEKNRKEFVACGKTDCLKYASANYSRELIQKERIRAVGRAIASAMDSNLIRNYSDHEENQGAFEYLENIGFNLHEVIYIVKTDSNVRAFILNSIILYIPVLICDVFLWIVIVKLIRHIRRFLVSNQQPQSSHSLLLQENDSEVTNRLMKSKISPPMKSKRLAIESEEDSDCSSFELSEQKVWYPPS